MLYQKQTIFEVKKQSQHPLYNTLIKSNCYYCNDFDIINGIDRQDCLQGYFENNCVPSCKICNFIKGKLSVDDFRKKIKNILIFNKKVTK